MWRVTAVARPSTLLSPNATRLWLHPHPLWSQKPAKSRQWIVWSLVCRETIITTFSDAFHSSSLAVRPKESFFLPSYRIGAPDSRMPPHLAKRTLQHGRGIQRSFRWISWINRGSSRSFSNMSGVPGHLPVDALEKIGLMYGARGFQDNLLQLCNVGNL